MLKMLRCWLMDEGCLIDIECKRLGVNVGHVDQQ